MLNGKTIGVVVPAYNEEIQILTVLSKMPSFVDHIIIVDDSSQDNTVKHVLEYINQPGHEERQIIQKKQIKQTPYNRADLILQDMQKKEMAYYTPSEIISERPETSRFILIRNMKNGGVGAAIARGYKWCLDNKIDCTAVMAGDGQMDPEELQSICEPVTRDNIDYVKGNRLIHRSAWLVVPKVRYIGNSILSILTKIASGYWHVSDTQCGYTAISLKALQAIRIHDIYRDYGMPNDLLVKLNIAFCTLKEVEIKPVYDIGEKSKMKIYKIMPLIAILLIKSFFKRLWIKYLFRDFHPLFLLYNLSFVLGLATLPYAFKILTISVFTNQNVSQLTMMAFVFLAISSFQSLLFAMWMDIQDNERLYK